MLSHDNLTWDAATITKFFNLSKENQEVVISYLPLSHVAAQVSIFLFFLVIIVIFS